MARGVALTNEEQASILALCRAGTSLRDIASNVSRSVTAVRNVLKVGRVRMRQRKRGATPKLSAQTRRIIIRKARTGLFSARQLRDNHAPFLSIRRVQQILAATPDLRYVNVEKAPRLRKSHRLARVRWAKEHLNRGLTHWRKTVFSDESRYTLDGPDGPQGYWSDKRSGAPRRWKSTRQAGGGGCMVWGAFSYYGKSALVFVDQRMNAEYYCELLEDALLPFLEAHPTAMTFQHDNAPCHSAEATTNWLLLNNVETMEWPACSPDCNPIENV